MPGCRRRVCVGGGCAGEVGQAVLPSAPQPPQCWVIENRSSAGVGRRSPMTAFRKQCVSSWLRQRGTSILAVRAPSLLRGMLFPPASQALRRPQDFAGPSPAQ